MSVAEELLPEFEMEMANTRNVLELVPDDKLDWKAGPTFQSIGWNASHLAEIANWTSGVLDEESWESRSPSGEPYRTPVLTSRAEILARFDAGVASAKQSIQKAKDEDMGKPWSLLDGGKPIFTYPRGAVYRTFIISHLIHHRAHLIVYLRLNGIQPPPMYGT